MKKFLKAIHIMRYYILVIFIFTLILIGINIWLIPKKYDLSWILITLFVLLSVIMVIVVDGITAAIIHHLPKKLFDPYRKEYRVSKFEKSFFRLIKIRKWKDKIPEIGALTCDFGKGKIENPNDPKYIYDFLIEMGYAESIHITSCLTGFLIIFILPIKYFVYIGLPISIINIGFNILSAWIQRYNRPKLLLLYERKIRNQ